MKPSEFKKAIDRLVKEGKSRIVWTPETGWIGLKPVKKETKTMKLKIEIDSDNDGCQTQADAVQMLKDLIARIKDDQTGSKVMDRNGNSVGTWELET